MTPNLFLVGAPKCGTSSLFDWLCRHPDIRGSKVKEPFFLIDPAHALARRPSLAADGPEAWNRLFADADAQAPIRMEGTTHYLFDPVARAAIASMRQACAVIVLREPAARVYSSFQYTANNLARLKSGLDFTGYLDLVREGRPLMPDWCTHPGSAHVLQNELHHSQYWLHVGAWLADMGPDRVRVLVMEDMIRNPQRTVAGVVAWLGLDPVSLPQIGMGSRNRTERVRFPRVQAVARAANARLRPPEAIRTALKRGYGAVQFRGAAEISAADRASLEALRESYAGDNARLAALTGLDLTAWHSAAPTAVQRR